MGCRLWVVGCCKLYVVCCRLFVVGCLSVGGWKSWMLGKYYKYKIVL